MSIEERNPDILDEGPEAVKNTDIPEPEGDDDYIPVQGIDGLPLIGGDDAFDLEDEDEDEEPLDEPHTIGKADMGTAMEKAMEFVTARRGTDSNRGKGSPVGRDAALTAVSRREAAAERPKTSGSNVSDIASSVLGIQGLIRTKMVHGPIAVIGVQEAPKENTVYALCLYDGKIVVQIPFEDFFPNRKPVVDDPSKLLVAKRQMLNRCICQNSKGGNIYVVFQSVGCVSNKDDHGQFRYVARASRVEAMRIQQERSFGSHARRRLDVGDRMTGKIVSVSANGTAVLVCAGGIDRRLFRSDLSSDVAIDNVRNFYKVGSDIEVEITKVDRDSTGRITNVEYSAEPVEREKRNAILANIPFGIVTPYKVISVAPINKGATFTYHISLTAFGVSARVSERFASVNNLSQQIVPGSTGLARIRKIDLDKGIIWAAIQTVDEPDLGM
jgi:hypothetical protein